MRGADSSKPLLSPNSAACPSRKYLGLKIIKQPEREERGNSQSTTASCKRIVPLFENSRPSAASQLGQPMHNQSANFGKFKLNSQPFTPSDPPWSDTCFHGHLDLNGNASASHSPG